jgi:hypothetical protein
MYDKEIDVVGTGEGIEASSLECKYSVKRG